MNIYIVAYDITDDRRRTKVFHYLRRWGNHLQYSVFRCELSRRQVEEFADEIKQLIHNDEDQVLLFDLGPSDGRARKAVLALGTPYTHPERHAFVF